MIVGDVVEDTWDAVAEVCAARVCSVNGSGTLMASILAVALMLAVPVLASWWDAACIWYASMLAVPVLASWQEAASAWCVLPLAVAVLAS